MYRARYSHNWGTRFERTYTDLFFTRKPTNKEIIAEFTKRKIRLTQECFKPECSGLITLTKIIPVF